MSWYFILLRHQVFMCSHTIFIVGFTINIDCLQKIIKSNSKWQLTDFCHQPMLVKIASDRLPSPAIFVKIAGVISWFVIWVWWKYMRRKFGKVFSVIWNKVDKWWLFSDFLEQLACIEEDGTKYQREWKPTTAKFNY